MGGWRGHATLELLSLGFSFPNPVQSLALLGSGVHAPPKVCNKSMKEKKNVVETITLQGFLVDSPPPPNTHIHTTNTTQKKNIVKPPPTDPRGLAPPSAEDLDPAVIPHHQA